MKCVKKDAISWTAIITGYVQNEEAQVGYMQNDSVFIFLQHSPSLIVLFIVIYGTSGFVIAWCL